MLNVKFNQAIKPAHSFKQQHLVQENFETATWFNIINCQQATTESHFYHQVCHNAANKKKWILLINPDNEALEQVSKQSKAHNKVLRLNVNKVKVDIDNITAALARGNCEQVIICNPLLSTAEIAKLKHCAEQGKTKCIILNTKPTLH